MPLRLTLVTLRIMQKGFYEFLIFLSEHLLCSQLLLQSLLLESGLHLILILDSLAPLLLLLRDTLLVTCPPHLSHLLLLSQFLLISLQLQLYLVLSSALGHFGIELSGLALFFLFDLRPLDLELLSVLCHLQLLGCLAFQSQVEGVLRIRTRVKILSSLKKSKIKSECLQRQPFRDLSNRNHNSFLPLS